MLRKFGIEKLNLHMANRTKEQIDKENELRIQMGEDKLPYEDEESIRLQQEETQRIESAEKERIRLEKEEEARQSSASIEGVAIKIAAKAPVVVKKEDPDLVVDEDDIDDDKLKKALEKRLGKSIESIDSVLTPKVAPAPEDTDKIKQERENRKIARALQTGKITKSDIDAYISDNNDRESVVYDHYYDNQKAVDPTLDDAEIEQSFNERFAINADKESREYKAARREITFLSDTLINQKHAKYLSIDSEFDSYEKNTLEEQKVTQEIHAKYPQFQKDISDVKSGLKTLKVALSDTESYDVELDDELLSTYTGRMLTPEYAKKIIAKGYTKEEIHDIVRSAVITDNFESIVKGVVDAAMLKRQAGLRGIPPKRNFRHESVVNEVQQQSLEALQEQLGVTAN